MSEWTIRPAVLEDEPALASMWLRQLCAGQDARAAGMAMARDSGSPEQIAYWSQHQPIVTALLRSATVRVVCDPERSTHEPGSPAVIWAWCCVDAGIVYGAGVKRRVVRQMPEMALEMTQDMLSAEFARSMSTVLDLVDLSRLKLIPSTWRRERGWASSLRELSGRTLGRDAMYLSVARHVVDESRVPWGPGA